MGRFGITARLVALAAALFVVAGDAAAQNLLTNPGFETGDATGWFQLGAGTLTAESTDPRSGVYAGLSAGRTDTWNGPAQDLLGVLQPGTSYRIKGWVRVSNAPSAYVQLTVKKVDQGTDYVFIDAATVTDGAWTELNGVFTLEAGASPSELFLYFEGPDSGVDYQVDDASVEALGDWKADANARIEQHRKRDVELLVVDELGRGIPGIDVQVDQTRHRFAFGSAMSGTVLHNQTYRDFFVDHFEWAVFENQTKWPANEPQRDQEDYADSDWMVDFCRQNGITMRGHTLFWAVDGRQPNWVNSISDAELQVEMDERIASAVSRYADDFLHWDVNNEMMHGSYFADRLGPGIRPWAFQQAAAADPDALLFVNDYNVITSIETDDYIAHVQDLESQGAPIHGLGVQGHFGDVVDAWAILDKLDRLAVLGKPIWVSEYDAVDRDENARADKLEALYRTAFSHPSVEGILMWGFWAGDHWRGRDAAIVNRNWTLNAAGVRYEALLAEWTTGAAGMTDAGGTYGFRGFHGTHDATLDDGTGSPEIGSFDLVPGTGPQQVVLPLDPASCLPAGEVRDLRLDHDGTTAVTTLTWQPPAEPAGMVLVYDTLRSADASDFTGASCVESGDGDDTTAEDAVTPASGSVAFFLVRGNNVCPSGNGPLGSDSAGNPRAGVDCS